VSVLRLRFPYRFGWTNHTWYRSKRGRSTTTNIGQMAHSVT